MFEKIDDRFDLIRQQFLKNGLSVDMIEKAYGLAKKLHKDQIRKDGSPYLAHPVEVAIILAKLGFDEDVISACLLHDVVEDCGYTVDEIGKEFNKNVAEMVDCVSAIDKEKYIFDKDDVYESEDFEKASIEEQSFKKLIAIGKKNPKGFCIKFADRLHNLRTIECFDYGKQLEKVKETEKWIIPIAKILNAEYFYRSLKNECFKIVHRYDGQEFFELYSNFHNANAKNIESLLEKFNEVFLNTPIKTIKIKPVREYKVFQDLQKILKNLNISKVSQGQILKVTNFNIYLLYDNVKYREIIGEIVNRLNNKFSKIKIIDAKVGSFTNKPYFQLQDDIKTKFNLYVMSHYDYAIQRNGTLDGQVNYLIDEDNLDSLETELIKVKTRSGEVKYIAKGSTVLDFAFKIHKDIGFGFKYALINNSKTKSPPYTKLIEGDQIEVFVERDSNGKIKNNADLKWFAYVNTDLAKKVLIKNFQEVMSKK